MAVSLKNQFPGEEEAIDELMRLMKVKRDRSKDNHDEVPQKEGWRDYGMD